MTVWCHQFYLARLTCGSGSSCNSHEGTALCVGEERMSGGMDERHIHIFGIMLY